MRSDLYLVDTSVWLEVLQAGRGVPMLRSRIDELLQADRVATSGIIRLELLSGTRTQREWEDFSGRLSALHGLAITDQHWDEAAHLGVQLRRHGMTIPSADLVIGAVALRADAVLVHRDRHFDLIASQVPLRVESYLTV